MVEFFKFIGEEQNARALGILGAIIGAVALAGWAIFKHWSGAKNHHSNEIPTLEEFRKILEAEREELLGTVEGVSKGNEASLRIQISELDKKLKDVREAYNLSVQQNAELQGRFDDLSSGYEETFSEALVAFNRRELDDAERHFSEYLRAIDPQLKDAASAFLGIAMSRAERADWPGAADAYSKSLMLHESEYALGQASRFLWYAGDQRTALSLSTRLVEKTAKSYGELSEATAKARALMAGQLYDLGELDEARVQTTAALATFEKLGKREDCFYFNLLMNMGNINFVGGDLNSAEDFHSRALSGLVANACDNEVIAAARNGLAETLRVKGKISEARKLLELNLKESRTLFGERHPHTARALNFLAKCEFDEGDIGSSMEHLIRSLEIQCERLGDFHHNSISIASNILGISREHPEFESDATKMVERKYGSIIDQAYTEVADSSVAGAS
ncbi:tetratricopeptide repeat protein [Citromicrobium bathyomarinum]|uniref:tetratricopeptide repeat protein n=1 Tax=Citromicrobium bathyomarinum TaxID=72174 RepID=UPI001E45FA7D|nr:tetratricopeptide repeat protein [Citromicrobium bathyomarinum]MCD1622247.1 tetratricopeptide repeat protein [Citromicrobium bathyomarinum]